MRFVFAMAIVAGLALVIVSAGSAATPVPPRIGDRVRVTLLAGPPPVTGRLVVSDAAGLGVRLDEETVREDSVFARRLARESIAGLEVGRTHSHPWRGALLGAVLMPAIMAAAISLSEPQGEEGLAYLGVIFGGPIVGAAFGALVGASIEHTRWDPAPLPDPADSTAVPPSAR